MDICSLCNEEAEVFDVIGEESIIKACALCSLRENLPHIKTPAPEEWKEAQRVRNVKERLIGLSKKQFSSQEKPILTSAKAEASLVDNFHWSIQKARKSKTLTQKQLAMALAEKEETIRDIELGKLPLENERVIKKLEQFLHLRLKR
ncbi:MAG: hypothetical protein AABX65_01540 [Nanoarchaeota archaeon]